MHPTFMRPDPWIEILFSIIIVASCLIIFFRTKELYELTLHKGIKYFRFAFLFFAFGFIMKLLFPVIKVFDYEPFAFRGYFGFIMMFTGTMALLCLLYSVIWKRIKSEKNDFYFLITLSLAFSIMTSLARIRFYVMLFQILVLLSIIIISYSNFRKEDRKSLHASLYVLYGMISVAWLANTAANFMSRISITTSITLNIISGALFIIALYKVIKKTRATRK
ncbi:MAG: hypothetical protein V1906_02170 [Candidatus Woesearchaeota archaeon]